MATKELFLCKTQELKAAKSFIKFFDELRDEVILYLDGNGNLLCFSSVCPHMAGEVVYSEKCRGIRCKWHGLNFDDQGVSINGKVKLPLRKYPTVVRDEEVYLVYEP